MSEVVGALLVSLDEEVVLQRRDGNTAYCPHMLGLFGGSVEAGENPYQAMYRELSEESSLDLSQIRLGLAVEQDFCKSKFYLFRIIIPTIDFEVNEGAGAEIYLVQEALTRSDTTQSARFMLRREIERDSIAIHTSKTA